MAAHREALVLGLGILAIILVAYLFRDKERDVVPADPPEDVSES